MATTKQTDNAPATAQTLAEALAAAQLEITDPAKDAVNPHFRSRYADLATVLKTVRPVLAKHGLAITQTTQVDEQGRLLLVTRLHWRDEELCGYYPIQPELAEVIGKVKACNALDDLKALKADCARLGAAAVAAYKARGQYLQQAAEAP